MNNELIIPKATPPHANRAVSMVVKKLYSKPLVRIAGGACPTTCELVILKATRPRAGRDRPRASEIIIIKATRPHAVRAGPTTLVLIKLTNKVCVVQKFKLKANRPPAPTTRV